MKASEPPRFATWLLTPLADSGSLWKDVTEQTATRVRTGRSSSPCWRRA